MLSLEEIEQGAQCTHKNTGLRYSVVEAGQDEVLLSAESQDLQDLVVPTPLFLTEFVLGERYHASRARGRGRGRSRARRGDDGKEVFFHRSGMNGSDYDSISEGDTVEYVIQEGPRGARAEHVRQIPPEVS